MFSKKPIMLVLIALFIALNAHALVLNAPEKLVANTNWNIAIDLDSTDSFTKTNVLLDDKLVMSIYSNGQTTVDPENGNLLVRASTYDEVPANASGLKAYISFIGLSEGMHSVSVKSYNNDTLIEERKQEISSFNPLNSSYQQEIEGKLDTKATDLQTQINSAKEKTSSIESRLNEILAKLEELNNSLSAKISEVDKREELKQLQSQASELTTLVQELKSENSQQGALLETKLDKPKPIEFNLSTTGLFSLGEGYKLAIVFIIGIIFLVMGYLRLRNRVPSSRGIGYTFRDTDYHKNVSLDQMVDEKAQTGKWGIVSRNKNEKKGFFAQDLIKKNP